MITTGNVFRHTAVYSAGSLIGKLVGFVMLPVFARVFETEGYAVIGMMQAATGLLGVLFSRAFSAGVTRQYHQEQTVEGKGNTLWVGVFLVIAQALVFLPLPLIFADRISGWVLGTDLYGPVVVMACLSLFLEILGHAAANYLIILQRSVSFAVVSLMRLVLGLTLTIYFVLGAGMGVVGVFVAELITNLFSALVLLGLMWKGFRPGWDSVIARKLIAFQWPLIPGDFVSFASRQAERILLRVLVDLNSVGILEMGYKFPPLIGLLITQPFLKAWRTESMELAEAGEAEYRVGAMFTNYVFTATFAGLLLAVNLDTVLRLLTPPAFWPAVFVGRLEVVTTILTGCFSYMEFGLLYSRRTKTLSTIIGVKSLVKLGVSYACIFLWGLQGAALSALITSAIALTWVIHASQKAYPIILEWRRLGAIVGVAAGIYGALQLGDGQLKELAGAVGTGLRGLLDGPDGPGEPGLVTAERLAGVAHMGLATLLAMTYLFIVPYVRPDAWARIRARIARRLPGGSRA